ncbi:MAG: aminotransferase class IV [Flavobacteriales bacterium]|nr:aminotransferase class IV [Flavobacteriales bacterium]
MNLVFFNGELLEKNDIVISSFYRAINYGDGFFESIKIINSTPINLSLHLNRIKHSLNVLHLSNKYLSENIIDHIQNLIKSNQILNGSLKINITRSGNGKYLPNNFTSNILITTKTGFSYKQNNAISICLFSDEYKSRGLLSSLKSSNSLLYILGTIYAKSKGFENALILNDLNNVIEATNSNIFIVKNNEISTPPIKDGCVDGVMRKWITNNENIHIKSISINEIYDSEEIFISNTISGVTPVKKINNQDFDIFKNANRLQHKIINSCSDL